MVKEDENGGMSSTLHFQGQSTISGLFLVVYVLVDDYLKVSKQAGYFKLPQSSSQKGSYTELIIIALVGELMELSRFKGLRHPLKQRSHPPHDPRQQRHEQLHYGKDAQRQ